MRIPTLEFKASCTTKTLLQNGNSEKKLRFPIIHVILVYYRKYAVLYIRSIKKPFVAQGACFRGDIF